MRRAFHAVWEEDELEAAQDHTRKPIKDPAARRDSHPGVFSAPAQPGTRPGHEADAAPVTAVHAGGHDGSCRGTPAHGVVDTCTDGL
eukprot:120537-Pleurochrysis_carterae.AAC.1